VRRAFTMVEMLLALTLASSVSLACIGVLGMMTRGDATLSDRSIATRELATLHGLLQETFGSLVMSDAERPSLIGGGQETDLDAMMADECHAIVGAPM